MVKNEIVNGWMNTMNCGFGRQGKRPSMEDEELIVENADFNLYAVFDGHGGDIVAKYCKQHLPSFIIKPLQSGKVNTKSQSDVKKWLVETFVQLDIEIYKVLGSKSQKTGCACIAVLHDKRHKAIYTINLGDSRCVLFNSKGDILIETVDHKPDDPSERKRIELGGGFVSKRPNSIHRVNGNLALSRSFGDWNLKLVNGVYDATKGPVSSEPHVICLVLNNGQQNYMVLACDGLWDTISTKAVVVQYLANLKKQNAEDNSCTRLANNSYNNGSRDNISVLAVMIDGKYQ